MNVRFMQRIDVCAGVPMCWALSTLNRVRRVFSSRAAAKRPPSRTLCIELSEIGSTVLAHSALELLKRRSGGEVYFLTFRKNAGAIELLGVLPRENVITIDDDSFGRFTTSAIAALRRIRKLKLDASIDLELFSRFTMMFSYLTGAKARVGFSNYTNEGLYRGDLLTHPVFYNPHQHMALNLLALVAGLLEGDEHPNGRPLVKVDVREFLLTPPETPIPAKEKDEIARLLERKVPAFGADSLMVLLSPDPGPALPLRGWAISNFIRLTKDLLAHSPHVLVGITGLKSSKPIAQEILDGLGPDERARVADFTGETSSMTALLALFRESHLLISNDGGSAHLASLTGLPMIVLFGPETPALYAPLGPGVTSVFAGLSCSPCLSAANHRHSVCTNNLCLQAITPESVLAEAVSKLFDRA